MSQTMGRTWRSLSSALNGPMETLAPHTPTIEVSLSGGQRKDSLSVAFWDALRIAGLVALVAYPTWLFFQIIGVIR